MIRHMVIFEHGLYEILKFESTCKTIGWGWRWRCHIECVEPQSTNTSRERKKNLVVERDI